MWVWVTSSDNCEYFIWSMNILISAMNIYYITTCVLGDHKRDSACTYRLLPLFLFWVFLTLVPRPSHYPFLTACSMQKQSEKDWCPFYHVSDIIAYLSRQGGRGEGDVSTNKTVTNGVNHVPLFTNFFLLLAHTTFVACRFFSIQSEYGRSG